MTSTSPIIGITAHRGRARWAIWDREADLLPVEFVDAVADAGGTPVIIPARSPVMPQLIAGLQGLILSGGPDVDPRRYGQVQHPHTDEPYPTATRQNSERSGPPSSWAFRSLPSAAAPRSSTCGQAET